MKSTGKEPDEVLSTTDKGDDVQRRFRYQSTYAAILSAYMCKDDSPYEEVYCELHEDVLLKNINGKFSGIQVKTRERHLGPFNAQDEEVVKSIVRFVRLNLQFPGSFDQFTIATNAGFSKQKNKCLESIVELAKGSDHTTLLKKRSASKTLIVAISKDVPCTENDVIAALSKLRLFGKISAMDDIRTKLTEQIATVLELKGHTYAQIHAIADSLILKHMEAASLSNEQSYSEHFVHSTDPKVATIKSIIDGKRIRKNDIKNWVKEQLRQPYLFSRRKVSEFQNQKAQTPYYNEKWM